jgi:solute carrier family 25 carnitine/acylcarnitine transporter 20/29
MALAFFLLCFSSHLLTVSYTTLSGVCNVAVGHPIDLVKVRMQTAVTQMTVNASSSSTTFGHLRTIFVAEGLTGLYRGVSAPLLAVTPAFAISFYSYDLALKGMREFSTNETNLTVGQSCLAGGFSGIPLAAVVAPSERIKCLMQVDKTKFTGFGDCMQQVYKEGGLRSVFRGLGATCVRDVPGNAAYFGTYELLRREFCCLEDTPTPTLHATLLAGGMAGVANWVVALPADTLKSRLQTAPAGKYRNLFDVFQQLVRKEGFSALFRGLSPALIRAFPSNAACLGAVETARSLFECQR